MSQSLSSLHITIPVLNGVEIPNGPVIEVKSFLQDKSLLRAQKTSLAKLHEWLGTVTTRAEATSTSRRWVDLFSGPMPMAIGLKGDTTTILVVRTWPAGHQWEDKVGKQKFALPPVIIGGTWKNDARFLVWSGVGVLPAIPAHFSPDTLIHPWPFGNVYDDGHICWGLNTNQDLVFPSTIFTMANRFFDTPFNSDLRREGWSIKDGKAVMSNSQIRISSWVRG